MARTSPPAAVRPRPPPARVRGNDWRAVELPTAMPAVRLSVVVPCFEAPRELERTLAALERQSLPRAMFEVLVVDDGSEPPLEAPRGTPLDLRVVRQERRGFGLARARNSGVRAARHDIVVFLDGDLVADAGLLAAHARWHAAVGDALTLGFCAYAEADGIGADALRHPAGAVAALFEERIVDPPWTERHMARTRDLTAPRDDLFRAVVGNNLGIRRALFDELGGFDESFDRYGWEDTEFGWRAQTAGALLVPVRAAFAWHQGRFAANHHAGKRRDVASQAARGAARIPHPDFRGSLPAGAAVPRTVVTVRAGPGAPATVADVLAGDDPDLVVIAEAGPGADARELRSLRERCPDDPRVRIAPPCAPEEAFPAAPFHVELPAGTAVDRSLLRSLRAGLGAAAVGVATLPDGARATITRAWAVHRSRRAGGRPEDYGPPRSFALRRTRPPAAAPGRRPWRALRTVRRPLAGPARLAAEAARVRTRQDAHALGQWLWEGCRWWVAVRRGPRRRRPARIAVRPRQLAALGVRRARVGDARAALRLLLPRPPRGVAYRALARGIRYGVAGPAGAGCGGGRRLGLLADGLSAAAPTATHAAAAAELARTLADGDRAEAARMARTAARSTDRRAEKVVSRRYRFVWIANPKAASRSLLRALERADPTAAVVREATLAEVYAAFPAARGYLSVAFVRNPLDRALSCYRDKVCRHGNVDLAPFAGLAPGMGVDAFCDWLQTPWGSDAFADRHWLSQDVLLREAPDAPLPDFVGRFERLAEDFAAVTARLGIPDAELRHLNAGTGAAPAPSPSARAALVRRYAEDYARFGYRPPRR